MPVRHGPWWYVTRTIEGQSYPVLCRGRTIDDATATVMLDCNAEAAGHDYFDVHAVDASPDHSLLAWSSDVDGSEHYTLRIRDLATGRRPRRRADRHIVMGRAGLVRRRAAPLLCQARRPDAAVPDLAAPPGTPPDEDQLVLEEVDERFYLGVASTRSERWIVVSINSKTSSEAWLLPADDPTGELRLVRRRSRRRRVRDRRLGRSVRRRHQPRRPGLPGDDRSPTTTPATWDELLPHEPGRRITTAEPFADHLVVHEWRDAQPRVRVRFRDGRRAPARPRRRAPRHRARTPTRSGTTTVVRSATSRSPRRPRSTSTMSSPASARCSSRRRHPASTCRRTRRSGRGRRPSTAPPSRSTSSADDDTPVDGRAPAWCTATGRTRRRCRRGSRSHGCRCSTAASTWALVHPRGGGELGRQLVPRRQAAEQAQHVHRHAQRRRTRRRPRLGRPGASGDPRRQRRRPARRRLRRRCDPTCSPAPSPRSRSSTSSTTMSDPSLPLTVTEWEEWGDPRDEPYASTC